MNAVIIKNRLYEITLKMRMAQYSVGNPCVNLLYLLERDGQDYLLSLFSDFTYRLYSKNPRGISARGGIAGLVIHEKNVPEVKTKTLNKIFSNSIC